jgi:RNA polymerase sigma factor (sigma-70 family)
MTPQAALVAYFAERTQENRDRLIAAYWYLCLRGAKKFGRSGVDRADLAQVGAIGLLKAVRGYNARLSTPFEAYAWLLVVGELMHYVRDHERIVRIPRTLRALEKRYSLVTAMLSSQLGREPTPAEIAAELQVDGAAVDELRLLRRGGAVVSLEAYTGSPTGELAAQPAALGIDERLSLRTAIDELGERERFAVLGSFAAGLSQAQLGQRLGLSQSQVSKVIKKALDKLHQKVA